MSSDDRRSERANVILTATIEAGGKRHRVRVSNFSAHGALVIGEHLPVAQTRLTFHCNALAVPGWIVWSQEGRAGIQSDDPVDPEALTKKAPTPQIAVTKDTRKVDFRRPGFRGNQMTDEERRIVEGLDPPVRRSP